MNSTECHSLLLIGAFVPEAASDNVQLLAAAAAVLDVLYAHFSNPPAAPATR